MPVTVDPKTKKLIIRFRVSGYPKQFYLSTGLKDNKSNRAIVDSRWELIQREISLDEFDPTLDRYKFGNKKKITNCQLPDINLLELWDKFTEFQQHSLQETTIKNIYSKIKIRLSKSPTIELSKSTIIRNWILKEYSTYSAWEMISYLERCCNWGLNNGLIDKNYFDGLNIKKPKKSNHQKIQAYTAAQRDFIIEEFYKKSIYGDLISFLFLTGCRHGEAFAMRWSDIGKDLSTITISKSCNFAGINKNTKNNKTRILPVAPGSRLHSLLIEMSDKNSTGLLFVNSRGDRLTSYLLNDIWGKSEGIVKEMSKAGTIPYIKPYSTRHTFATLAISAGISPDKVAYWLGDEIQTVLKHYCHTNTVITPVPDF